MAKKDHFLIVAMTEFWQADVTVDPLASALHVVRACWVSRRRLLVDIVDATGLIVVFVMNQLMIDDDDYSTLTRKIPSDVAPVLALLSLVVHGCWYDIAFTFTLHCLSPEKNPPPCMNRSTGLR